MNKYNSLLSHIAFKLGIRKGDSESEENYKSRLIYSAISRIGYASLWDKLEDNVPVSIEHFRRRIENTLSSYLKMYPEVEGFFPDKYNVISGNMYNTFLATGNVYHSPRRISPPIRRQAAFNGIEFLRGTTLSENISISGIGTFVKCSDNSDAELTKDMFGLTKQSIVDYWLHYSELAMWTTLKTEEKFEYLNTTPPFFQKWNEKPSKKGMVSIMRTDTIGKEIYYFYRFKDEEIEVSQIPYWLTEDDSRTYLSTNGTKKDNVYLYLTNGCLASQELLPHISYKYDGAISALSIKYPLPPAEQNMIMLYSWPKIISNVESPFYRIIDTNVLKAIIELFSQIGFIFKEE